MLLYRTWAFFRQNAARLGILCEEGLYALTGGKAPKALFSKRAGAEYIGTSVRIVKENNYSTDIAKFDGDGNMTDEDFTILSSTDFHFDEDTELNAKTVEMFMRQIKDAKPDLIVLTGDVILSKYQQVDAIKFARMMEKTGIYWTAVFGNHEAREEKGFYKWLLCKSFSDYPHCLCKHGPDELFGYANHTVNILGKGGRLRETLFLFDSGRDIRPEYRAEYKIPDDMKGYDFLKSNQIEFYKKELDRLASEYNKAPSIMYMHIPLKEYEEIFEDDGKGGYRPTGNYDILYGGQYESVGSSPYNSGMFDAITEKGSTRAVFAGHDHVNDWCALYKGVYLVYSQDANYNPYHMGTNFNKPESEWIQGVTLTVIHPDGSLDIRPSYNRKYLNGGNNK